MPPADAATLTPSHSVKGNASAPASARTQPRWADLLAVVLALACAAAGLALAAHHPLSPTVAVLAWLAAAAFAARFVVLTPALLLGSLPLIGLAPWSGWITFEELDLLALACAAGGYAALALAGFNPRAAVRVPSWRRLLSFSPLALLLLGLFAVSLLLAMRRGFADAGGFSFGWFQGYHEAMNSLRLTKSFFLVALLLPLWLRAGKRQPHLLAQALLWGMVLALGGASLAALAERQAFTGLLNFSTDYRSTALFWEMHVGGAALDGCLALTAPFAVLALLRERRPWRFGLLMALTVLAAYAVLTTFSRGLYMAVPTSLVVLVLLRDGQRRRAARLLGSGAGPVSLPLPRVAKLGALLMAAAFMAAAVLVFGGGGYRGLLALLGVMALLLVMPASLWLPSPAQRVTGLLMGALMAAVLTGAGWSVAMAVPKAAYVQYVLAFVVAVWLRSRDKPGVAQPVYACLVTASWFWLLGCMAVVAGDWGGDLGLSNALLALLLLGLLWPLFWLCAPLWPLVDQGGRGPRAAGDRPEGREWREWRHRSLLFTGLLMASAVIASLGGGDYVRDRAASWKEDLHLRQAHWKQGLALLDTRQEWLLGQGAGRFVANHFFAGPITQHTGDYRLKAESGGGAPYLVLTGGKHQLGYGELFRVSQRIAAPDAAASGPVQLAVRVRAPQDAVLHVEVCEKQLLYIENCLSKTLPVKAQPDGAWQSGSVDLGRATPMGGSWYAPRFVTFSIAVDTTGGVLELASLNLTDGRGHALLANGDFSHQLAHWFFSSDRYHLPWHIKNLGLHVLFEQGLVGLALLGALLLMALLRLAFGRGREHALAPALAASLVGFLVVGLFDSLLDAPRIAFIFYTVLLFSMGLRAVPGAEPSK